MCVHGLNREGWPVQRPFVVQQHHTHRSACQLRRWQDHLHVTHLHGVTLQSGARARAARRTQSVSGCLQRRHGRLRRPGLPQAKYWWGKDIRNLRQQHPVCQWSVGSQPRQSKTTAGTVQRVPRHAVAAQVERHGEHGRLETIPLRLTRAQVQHPRVVRTAQDSQATCNPGLGLGEENRHGGLACSGPLHLREKQDHAARQWKA